MEFNDENKSKFFALYWGQKIMTYPSGGLNGSKESIDMVGWLISSGDIHSYYLNLKPLSQISDDDAFQCGFGNSKSFLSINLNHYISIGRHIDYLRSKGYALPWMELSVDEMVDAGWVKLAN